MKFVTTAAIAALCAAFVLAPASAAGLTDCVSMSKQVSEALSAAQPNANNLAQARTEANSGRSYCAMGMYAQGVARYTKALQLLGKA